MAGRKSTRTVLCCLQFDSKPMRFLGYALAVSILAIVFGWIASYLLVLPVMKSQDPNIKQYVCTISDADVQCIDNLKLSCYVSVNITLMSIEENMTVTSKHEKVHYPTGSTLCRIRAVEAGESLLMRPSRICWATIVKQENVTYVSLDSTVLSAAPISYLTFSNPKSLNSVHIAIGGIAILAGALFTILSTSFLILALLRAQCTCCCGRNRKNVHHLCGSKSCDILSVRSTEYKPSSKDGILPSGADPVLFSKDPVVINAEESQPLVEPRYLATRLERAHFIRNVTALTSLLLMIPTAIALCCASITVVQDWMARQLHWWFGMCLALMMLTSMLVVLCFRIRVINVIITLILPQNVSLGLLVGCVATLQGLVGALHTLVLIQVSLFITLVFSLLLSLSYCSNDRLRTHTGFAATLVLCWISILTTSVGIHCFVEKFPSALQACVSVVVACVWTMFFLWQLARAIVLVQKRNQWHTIVCRIFADALNVVWLLLRIGQSSKRRKGKNDPEQPSPSAEDQVADHPTDLLD